MITTVCVGWYDLDDKHFECDKVISREDLDGEGEITRYGKCPECWKAAEEIAEAFFNQEGRSDNIY